MEKEQPNGRWRILAIALVAAGITVVSAVIGIVWNKVEKLEDRVTDISVRISAGKARREDLTRRVERLEKFH